MKRKSIFSVILILFYSSILLSQTYVFQAREKGSKNWGYANFEGKMIIEPKFNYCSEFSEQGFATVMYKNKYQVINLKGEIIETELKNIQPNTNYWSHFPQTFLDGYLVVFKNEKYGCLNMDGKIAIPIEYEHLTQFNRGFALAEKNKTFYVLDKKAREIPVKASEVKHVWHFSEGLGIIEVKGQKWGFIDSTGKVVIEPQFDGTGYFSGGIAWARTREGTIGFINKKGEWVIRPMFQSAKDFDLESGLAMVKINAKWRYVNTKGEIFYFDETEKTYVFLNGLAIGKKNGKVGFLNNKGEWAIPPTFDGARPFYNGYAAVELDKLWGIIDKCGNWIVQPKFKDIKDVVEIK